MSNHELELAFRFIDAHGGGDFEGPKEELIVEQAENILGLKFPNTYKKFLLRLGCGDICGLEFYGVIHGNFDNSGVPDAVWLTLQKRKRGLPESLVLIYAVGDGTNYAIDTSKVNDEGESPIVIYDGNGNTVIAFEDFGSFLLSELETIM